MALVERNPPTGFRKDSNSDDNDSVFKKERNADLGRGSPNDAVINAKFRHFARRYIVNQLRKKGFEDVANKHDTSSDTEEPENGSQHLLHHLAGDLAEERERQFEDILSRLGLTNDNLSETYGVIVQEMFIDGVNWGRILAFLVFSGALAVHCAREGMENRVGDVISWTQNDVERTVSRWVVEQGGWRAFVNHFDAGTWTIDSPQCILAGILLILAGGFYLLKKLF